MAKKTQNTKLAASTRTSAGLRDALFDELDCLRNGTSSPAKANAVAKLCTVAIDSVRMEVEVQKHFERIGSEARVSADLGSPLALGS